MQGKLEHDVQDVFANIARRLQKYSPSLPRFLVSAVFLVAIPAAR